MKELEKLAERLERLRARISRARRSQRQLPTELWSEAREWATKLGAYRASRALGVSYEALRQRTRRGDETAPAFVEFSGAELMQAKSGPVVELTDGGGVRLTIQLGAGQPLDAAAVVVRAFLRGRR